jgi:hypothetical protein
MMRRRTGQVATMCIGVLAVGAACRQLVGIGDAPPIGSGDAGAVCGIAYSGGDCEACLESRCCALASACAHRASCNVLQTCLGECQGDPTCRSRCTFENVGSPDPAEAQLSACLAAQCSAPCGLACGGGAAALVGPDAAASCQSCIVANACTQATTCAGDPECAAYARCSLANPLLDELQACQSAHAAGAAEFQALFGVERAQCANDCAVGQQWQCLGHVPGTPPPLGPSTAVTLTIRDTSQAPVPGALVQVCPLFDIACPVALSSGTTDDAGTTTVNVPPGPQGFGVTGYLSITAPPTLAPELLFWGFPLSEPTVVFPTSGLPTPAVVTMVSNALGDPIAADRAFVLVEVADCDNFTAPGVTLSLDAPDAGDAGWQLFYRENGAFSKTAKSTDGLGQALLANVPAGSITITATPVALGRPSSIVTAYTRAGWGTEVALPPNQ